VKSSLFSFLGDLGVLAVKKKEIKHLNYNRYNVLFILVCGFWRGARQVKSYGRQTADSDRGKRTILNLKFKI
jgi:hypothetical protein